MQDLFEYIMWYKEFFSCVPFSIQLGKISKIIPLLLFQSFYLCPCVACHFFAIWVKSKSRINFLLKWKMSSPKNDISAIIFCLYSSDVIPKLYDFLLWSIKEDAVQQESMVSNFLRIPDVIKMCSAEERKSCRFKTFDFWVDCPFKSCLDCCRGLKLLPAWYFCRTAHTYRFVEHFLLLKLIFPRQLNSPAIPLLHVFPLFMVAVFPPLLLESGIFSLLFLLCLDLSLVVWV